MKILFALLIIISTNMKAQITEDVIENVLTLKYELSDSNLDCVDIKTETAYLWERYNLKYRYQSRDLMFGLFYGTVSGIFLGLHEAYTFNYQYTSWLPGWAEDWYQFRLKKADGVFERIFTVHKIARAIEEMTSVSSWNNLYRYYGGNWFYTYISYFTIKNLFATVVRDKFKTDKWFYSFKIDLIFTVPAL